MLPKNVGNGWEKNGVNMKIRIKDEEVNKEFARIIYELNGEPLLKPVSIRILLGDKGFVDQVSLYPNSDKENILWLEDKKSYWFNRSIDINQYFSFEDFELKGKYYEKIENNEYGFQEYILPSISKQIRRLKLKMKIVKNKQWIFPWLEKKYFPGMLDSE